MSSLESGCWGCDGWFNEVGGSMGESERLNGRLINEIGKRGGRLMGGLMG